MAKNGDGPPAGEPWCWYTRAMLLSPAFSEASINCRRLIAALEVENMSHAGTENGNLVLPYLQLERSWGIGRRLIRPAIDEAIKRGLIRVTGGDFRLWLAKSMLAKFRLTFRPTREGTAAHWNWKPPTDEWRRCRVTHKRSRTIGTGVVVPSIAMTSGTRDIERSSPS
jgi:hypothetical protein